MAMANDMTALLNKVSNRLGLKPLEPHLPDYCKKDKWADVVMEDSIVTFSRYFPNKFPFVVDETTCDKKEERGTTWYYIKDEILQGVKLLGLSDIDWTDHTAKNASVGATSIGGGYYMPSMACPTATFESILSLQMNADMASLYNRGLFLDFQYPNRFSVKGLANTNYDLKSFVINLLVEHCSLSTISPTKMETFEALAQADIAKFLYMNLRYYDGFETAYVNIDLKLSELNDEMSKRDNVIEKMQQSFHTPDNENTPYIWSV